VLEIVEGDLDEAKAELKEVLALVQKRISQFKKSVPKKKRSDKQLKYIAKHESFLHRYRVSAMLPVQIEGITINYLLHEKMLKKLRGFDLFYEFYPEKMVLVYKKGATSGRLELADLTGQLDGVLNKIPKAEVKEELPC